MNLGKKSRDRSSTQSSLIEAATVLFAEKGYENCTTKEIAAAAQCNEALIQRYFAGKNGLLLAVLQKEKDQEASFQIRHLPYHERLIDELLQLCDVTRTLMQQRGDAIRIVLSRVLVDPDFQIRFLQVHLSDPYQNAIAERLRHYQNRSLLAAHWDVTVAADVIVSLMLQIGFFKPEIFQMNELDVSTRLQFLCEVLAKGLDPQAVR